LDSHPEEFDEIINSLAINVTEFFRNPEIFEALNDIVIPRVIASKRQYQHRVIKAWSCGCSSGDEPYSLAILFLEKLGSAKERFSVSVIGSDIDKGALDEAKDMVYSRERLKAINENLLAAYFERADGDSFRLKGAVRDLVTFKLHDVIRDEPFLHCDIILCRNLFIYFNRQLQEEVLFKFYESLNPGGFLVLGMVESLVGAAANAFENVNNRLRIYRRPQEPGLQYKRAEILSQEEIDGIVREMLK
jgi:chemotaxis protein methyltransferase CheR